VSVQAVSSLAVGDDDVDDSDRQLDRGAGAHAGRHDRTREECRHWPRRTGPAICLTRSD